MNGVAWILCGLLAFAYGRTIQTNTKPRVVNGEDAKLGERPFQVSLQIDGFHFCGGSIINEYWVVTAAHCVNAEKPSDVQVVAGTVNLKEPYNKHQAEKLIYHKEFPYGPDIAVIKVSTPFKFSPRVQPVPLPELHREVKTNSTAVLSGWGALGDKSYPDKLQKVTLYIADQEYCYNANGGIFPTDICAYDPYVSKGQCSGDSGGPLTVDGILVGIVSWSKKDPDCGSTKYPGVYTRVPELVDWIYKNID